MAKADPHPLFAEPTLADGSGAREGDQLDHAFGKLEAALSRLEQAATLRPPVDTEVLKLKIDNAALRGTLRDALGQIDSLLADVDGDD